MEVLNDDLWFCEDCAGYVETGETEGLEEYYNEEELAERLRDIEAGIRILYNGRNRSLHMGDDTLEFSRSECDCCGTSLGGRRYQFVLLG